MTFEFASLFTLSFWRHILLSRHTWARFLEAVGGLFLVAEVLRFFGMYPAIAEGRRGFWTMMIVAFAIGCTARFPVKRVRYKIKKKDYEYEVWIGDILALSSDAVISTNTTFDTSISEGRIAANSLQGQFTMREYSGEVPRLDADITKSLSDRDFEKVERPGKKKKYPMGTVAVVKPGIRTFYLLAMANMNDNGNAQTTAPELEKALAALWQEIADRGELGDVAIPVVGTGRGRLQLPRQKVIELIAQSFADASRDRKIANRLIIVISPTDAAEHDINLFQIRDYLTQSLYT